jgi:hypothetical protein
VPMGEPCQAKHWHTVSCMTDRAGRSIGHGLLPDQAGLGRSSKPDQAREAGQAVRPVEWAVPGRWVSVHCNTHTGGMGCDE